MKKSYLGSYFAGFFIFLFFLSPVFAADFHCEVLAVKGLAIASSAKSGDRNLKKGDLLAAGDELTVGDQSYVDLAYDKDWQNITRLEQNTSVKIVSLTPGKLDLKNGAVFAKLKRLPRESEFEVKTPTAVATVRGTEYLTRHQKGKTEVLNASSSLIYVYGFNEDGSVNKQSEVILKESAKTGVSKSGQLPSEPLIITSDEKKDVETLGLKIQENIQEAASEGRKSSIQSIEEMEAFIQEKKKLLEQKNSSLGSDELSRITDNRRRAFAGQNSMAPPDEPSQDQAPQAPDEKK